MRRRSGPRIGRGPLFFKQLPVESCLAIRIFFAARARVSDGKLIMAGKIFGDHSHILLKLRNGIGKAPR